MVELVAAAQIIWPIAAWVVGIGAGMKLIQRLLDPPEVHSGNEEEYRPVDDGYHDKYGASAEDLIMDFDEDGSGVTDGDWREAIGRRGHIDDDLDFDMSSDGESLIDGSDDFRDSDDSIY